ALPQLVDDLHVFFGDLVARVVLRLSRKPDALGGAVQISGDDVPADAPAGQMIERRKPAGQRVRETWMRTERTPLSRHAETAKAIDYMLTRWPAFTRFLDDGRICLTNNAAERALRGIALYVF